MGDGDAWIADVVIAVMLVEGVWLARRTRDPSGVALALLPGLLIVGAVRAALVGADWRIVGALLALSAIPHLADLRRRGWLPGGAGPAIRNRSSDRR